MRLTVLIVDDSPSYRTAARALLESEGFEVVGESTTGEDALADWEHLRPDVVLLDIGLPGIDGIAVAERLTARANGPAVVLVSSRDGAGWEQVFDRCGARGFIPKAELSGEAITALAA
jgi:DNA-binding NarL/FixJ family response regulator